jgi:hypothetical protein
MAALRSVVQEGPPPLPKMNPWKQAGKIATGMFLGQDAAEAIWHPKYNRQVDEYGQRVGQAKAVSDIDMAEENRQQAIAKAEATIGAQNATADRNQRQGRLYDQQSAASAAGVVREEEKLSRTSPESQRQQRRTLAEELGFVPGTSEFNELMVEGKYTDPSTKRKVTVNFQRNAVTGDVTAIKYDENGNKVGDVDTYKGVAPSRPPVGRSAGGPSVAQRRSVEVWKSREEKGLSSTYLKEAAKIRINDANDPPQFESMEDLEAWRREEQQRIENDYAAQLSAVTGEEVTPYDPNNRPHPPLPNLPKPRLPARLVGGSTTSPARPTTPTASPAPQPLVGKKTYTEAEIRAKATASGADPDRVLREARAAGIVR